jgi:AraC-like DNA-binding protein
MSFTLSEFLPGKNESFVIKRGQIYHALNEFHSHPELELIHITEGTGILLIGEMPISVQGGELILIGCNVPHMFRFERQKFYDPIMLQGAMPAPLNLLLLHFDPKVFGDVFINVPENGMLKMLLKKAKNGLSIEGELKNEVLMMMDSLASASVHERLIHLLTLLNKIAANDCRQLINTESSMDINRSDEARLTKVFLMTMHNFNKRIRLKEVAETVYMAPNAFCNYFKHKTGKTFFEFLLEVRINHACKLLREADFSVVMICYDSGFTNLSNFNRQFKGYTGKTPLEYRKHFKAA